MILRNPHHIRKFLRSYHNIMQSRPATRGSARACAKWLRVLNRLRARYRHQPLEIDPSSRTLRASVK